MELLLKVIAPSGQVSLLPIKEGRIELDAASGERYQLIVNGSDTAPGPRVMRFLDDLVVDGLGTGDEIQITGFFSACAPNDMCRFEVYLDGENVASALITPVSEPMAAVTGGGFIMAQPGAGESTVPPPPEGESAPIWRPIMAGGAGLLVLGAAAGSGGAGGDSAPPATPVVSSSSAVNTTFPELSGTAEAQSQLTIVLSPVNGDPITYTTRADANGSWTINTAVDTPQSGILPANGLPQNAPIGLEVIARDASGNLSSTSRSALVIDALAPPAPTIELEDSAANGQALLNSAELANGLTVVGNSEPASTVTVSLSGINISQQITANADGRYAVTFGAQGLPLADGQYTLTAAAEDAAANRSETAQISVTIDRSLSAIDARIDSVVDDRVPIVGDIANGAITNDSAPVLRGEFVGTLAADEQLQVLLDGQAFGNATTQLGSWEFATPTPIADGPHTFSLQLIDAAGNAQTPPSMTPRTLTIDTQVPQQQISIATVLDDSGGLPVTIGNGGSTFDESPVIRITLDSVLNSGETVFVQRASSGGLVNLGIASPVAGDPSSLTYQLVDNNAPTSSAVAYRAQVIDAAGQLGPLSPLYAIQIFAPTSLSELY